MQLRPLDTQHEVLVQPHARDVRGAAVELVRGRRSGLHIDGPHAANTDGATARAIARVRACCARCGDMGAIARGRARYARCKDGCQLCFCTPPWQGAKTAHGPTLLLM